MKVTFPLLLFTVFLVLKLTNVIAWSWWWVTAPLWAGLAIAAVVAVLAFFAVALSRARKQSRS
jgi:hypothetical protein